MAPSDGENRRFSTSGLPPNAYDGSHLSWQAFRGNVLTPHGIRITQSPCRKLLPTDLLDFIEAQSPNVARFEKQKADFKAQVIAGRGFGPSPLFPPNLLPPIEENSLLARCIIPRFSRDALPDRVPKHQASSYELSVPRSGLGCGFSVNAFSSDELETLPAWLVILGTEINFDTGYVSPGAAVYCPFLTFERAWGTKEERLETALNQCAIAGSWCLRAIQKLYNQAYSSKVIPELPISFSCTVENGFAILNFHWIDHGECYYMAPLCKFELTKDEHFSQFLLWVEGINVWGVKTLLPRIQEALRELKASDPTPPPTPIAPPKLSLAIETDKEESLMKALQTTFDGIPWKLEDNDFTPVSSSIASWGSPILGQSPLARREFSPSVTLTGPNEPMPNQVSERVASLPTGKTTTPPPVYASYPDLLTQKRLSHALHEIRGLQDQLQAMRSEVIGLTTSLQSELSGMKHKLASVLPKEKVRSSSHSRLSRTSPPFTRMPPTPDRECSSRTLEVTKEASARSNDSLPDTFSLGPFDSDKSSPRWAFSTWAIVVFSGQVLGAFASHAGLHILLLGWLSGMCIRVFQGRFHPVYFRRFWESWGAK